MQVRFSGGRAESPERENWADEIAAFANTLGGFLLCGVTRGGEVQGMSPGQMDEKDVEEALVISRGSYC